MSRAEERKHVAILRCELSDSVTLAERLDLEDFRELVRSCQAACADTIKKYGGRVARYTDSGIMACFGYPSVSEETLSGAARAALAMISGIKRCVRAGPDYSNLRLCIGIDQGLVLIEEGEDNLSLIGPPTFVAERLVRLAGGDEILITSDIYTVLRHRFACEQRGHRSETTPGGITVYAIQREREIGSRFDYNITLGLTPFIGRERDIGILLDNWRQAKAAKGRTVAIIGEAGIGKSRVLYTFKNQLVAERHARLECQCWEHCQRSPFQPIITLLERLLEFSDSQHVELKSQQLENLLMRYAMSLPSFFPLMATLLSLPLGSRYVLPALSPQRHREELLKAVITLILRISEEQPLLMIVEDLHWIDPTTKEFLALLIERTTSSQVLIVLSCRPEFRAPWLGTTRVCSIELSRLSTSLARLMVTRIVDKALIPDLLVEQIIDQADGVPLFLEEVSRAIVEAEVPGNRQDSAEVGKPIQGRAIPLILRDPLMARLDQLGAAREVAQWAAVIGREFTYDVINAISSIKEIQLQKLLEQIVDAGILFQDGLPPTSIYLFKHSLIQEAAYSSIPRYRKQQLHHAIARFLEQRTSQHSTMPEVLARHFSHAGLEGEAIEYWQRAGEYAAQRSAYPEALGHLKEGLSLVAKIEAPLLREEKAAGLQLALATTLVATCGYADPDVKDAFDQAWELCSRAADAHRRLVATRGLWTFHLAGGRCNTADELSFEMLKQASSSSDPGELLEGYTARAFTLFHMGAPAAAARFLEAALRSYERIDPDRHMLLYGGADPAVALLSYLAWARWQLGNVESAMQCSRQAQSKAVGRAHPFSQQFASMFLCGLHQFRGDADMLEQSANLMIEQAREQRYPFWMSLGQIYRGWAVCIRGTSPEGIAEMKNGLAAYRAVGGGAFVTLHLAMLAEACIKQGMYIEARAFVDDGLRLADRAKESFNRSELHRLRGELELAESGNLAAAETSFKESLMVAKRQGARPLEFRASISLAQCLIREGQFKLAQELLLEGQKIFSEGQGTFDWQHSCMLLLAIASQVE